MIKLPPSLLRGSYPPLLTPFKADGAVDYEAYAKLVEFQIREGSHGIVVNGTTAEPSVLSVSERCQLLDVALSAAAGRVPVMAATGSQSHAETVTLTEHADKSGADALLIVTPYYIRPPQRGLVAYYLDLCRRTERPVLIYHIPGRAAVSMTIDTLTQIVEGAPNLVGMKHAVAEMGLVTEALSAFGPEFRVLVGLEELSFPMMAMGACGMVNAVSNIAPSRIVALYDAVASGNLEEGRRLHFELFDLNRAVFFDTNPIPIKYMAKVLGILPDNLHRLPMMPASADVMSRCDEILLHSGLTRQSALAGD